MTARYLFGPVSAGYAATNLAAARQAGSCLAFNARGDVDLAVGPRDDWASIMARCPAGWRPDFVVLYLPYTAIPAGLWEAPVPIVGLAPDWNLLWHYYRRCLPSCELVLTDAPGVDALAREGLDHARAAVLYGANPTLASTEPAAGPRDVDVLFVGNLNPAVQAERLSWLGRLGRLGGRRNVRIAGGVFGPDYHALLQQTRIVFNRSVRGEANLRAFEALAAGALLFQEEGNRELPQLLADRQECVYYSAHNLETLLDYYLDHEDERQAIAAAGQARAREYTFAKLWDAECQAIAETLPELTQRAAVRPRPAAAAALVTRTQAVLSAAEGDDPDLVPALRAAAATSPCDPALANALGLLVSRTRGRHAATSRAVAETAATQFRLAHDAAPTGVVAALNLAEALHDAGRTPEAIQVAQRLLERLDHAETLLPWERDAGHFPAAFDLFRTEWERAAWANAGNVVEEDRAKLALLRWRTHLVLADLTGELSHFYEAVLARPDLAPTRAALGCALGRAGQARAAVAHLRQAVAQNPFDAAAARAEFQAMGDAGDQAGQRRLARDRRQLAKAAPGLVPEEAWVRQTPPAGDELASIIVLGFNQLDYTRACLESVLRHTRAPYELILVDNGSTDATPAYFAELRRRPGPDRVVVIRNESNRGFPAGCNQGLLQARGDYLVFLNNDTIVTAGWLDGLVRPIVQGWPAVGMVGAVSNQAPPPQQVPIDYDDVAGIDGFAAERCRAFAGQVLTFPRLTGFCLLARRDVLSAIGGFDERFGLGFFDDDDLCMRVRAADFQLQVALDVFIHHFGSQTFKGLDLDCGALLQANLERFKEKWGAEAAAPYRPMLPAAVGRLSESARVGRLSESAPPCGTSHSASIPADSESRPTRPRVSLCMIVREEEHNLPDCLAGVAGLVDEMIIVDTGSKDRTREVAIQAGAKVFDFPWIDDFAAARNESLRHATGDWIFWLDADDRLDAANQASLRTLFASLKDDNAAYAMKCLCLADPVHRTVTAVDHVRLFRNQPGLRWTYRVHEQILPALRQAGTLVHFTPLTIQHLGYQDPALRRRKLERDRRLLRQEETQRPDDPFVLFNLGCIAQEMGAPSEAIPYLQRSLERSHPQDSIVRKLYALLSQCHRLLGDRPRAAELCRKGREVYPADVELLFLDGLLRRELGDLRAAEDCWRRLLTQRAGEYFGSVDASLAGYKARHNLATLYREQDRMPEAAAEWEAVLAEQPGFAPALSGLAEIALAGKDWPALEARAAELEQADANAEATAFRVRGQLVRGEFAAARAALEAAIAVAPKAAWPRRLLSYALLQEGRDPAAADAALRALLEIDPDNAEAKHNLAVLRRSQAGSSAA